MIVIKTKLKTIPDTCTKCKYSEIDYSFYGNKNRICSITKEDVPYEFFPERKNWCYTKCKKCPLTEIND